MAFEISNIITALGHSLLVALLILPVVFCRVVAWRKSICRLLAVDTAGFHMTLLTGMYKTWLKRFFHHGRETEALSANRLYAVRAAVWAVPTGEQCSLPSAVADMCPPSQVHPEVVE